MAIAKEHELHHRRFGRNLGLGLVLVTMVAIIFGLTFVKVTVLDPALNGTAHSGHSQQVSP